MASNLPGWQDEDAERDEASRGLSKASKQIVKSDRIIKGKGTFIIIITTNFV
jgi:hypothetical protein